MAEAEAVAALARKVAAALQEFADEYVASSTTTGDVVVPDGSAADLLDQSLGYRQRDIAQLAELATAEGMTTRNIGRAIGYDQPNVYLTLHSLERRGIVERIPEVRPQRYRLTARYRGTAGPYLQLASLVRPGEWTTDVDISIAQRGDTLSAPAVGRAAATLPDFPNPHRILLESGAIPSSWHDAQSQGPEECKRRLEAEGVGFTEDAVADPMRRVTWDVLVERRKAA